jgi:hypothetical protein
MDSRVERIKELLSKKEEIERELDQIRVQLKEEKLAFSSARRDLTSNLSWIMHQRCSTGLAELLQICYAPCS